MRNLLHDKDFYRAAAMRNPALNVASKLLSYLLVLCPHISKGYLPN